MKIEEQNKLKEVLLQTDIMRMPDQINSIIFGKEIEGECKYSSFSNYLSEAGFVSLILEIAGQYAEILIRNSEKLGMEKMFLAEVKDLKIYRDIAQNDISIRVRLTMKIKNIYKSYAEVYVKDELIASGYLMHVRE